MPDTQIREYRFYVLVMAKYRLVDLVRPRMDSMKREEVEEEGLKEREGERESEAASMLTGLFIRSGKTFC